MPADPDPVVADPVVADPVNSDPVNPDPVDPRAGELPTTDRRTDAHRLRAADRHVAGGEDSGRHDRPIALFDSGFGGLTVARAVIDLLPEEHIVYVGDTGRYPYGPRPQEEVADFAHQITRHLVDDLGAKLVIVACNTAAAAALGALQATAGVPVVGVIEPGVRSLVAATRSGRIGVIGTVGTIGSGAYQQAVAATGAPVELAAAACPGFVEFVERDETRTEQVHVLAERLLAPIVTADVDTLLLGCTHYPYLARTISDVMGRDVVLVSSADETAFEVRSLLGTEGGPAARAPDGEAPVRRFLSSGDVDRFRDLGSRLLGPELAMVERAPWA